MSVSRRGTSRLSLLAAAMVLAGCSSDTAGPSSAPAMSQAEASAASDVVVADAADLSDGSTASSGNGATFSIASTGAAAASAPWWSRACTPAPTITVSGGTTTYTFDNCTISRPVSLESIIRNGQVAVTTGGGIRTVEFTDFSKEYIRIALATGKPDTTSETRTGTRQTTGDATTLTHKVFGLGDPAATFMVTDYAYRDKSTSEHQRNWHATFTADVAGAIAADQPLPSGVWNIAGNGTWTRTPAGSSTPKSWTFTTTASNLHYNTTCVSTPQFDSGTLTVQSTNKQTGGTTTFTITFTACGTYTTTITKTS